MFQVSVSTYSRAGLAVVTLGHPNYNVIPLNVTRMSLKNQRTTVESFDHQGISRCLYYYYLIIR